MTSIVDLFVRLCTFFEEYGIDATPLDPSVLPSFQAANEVIAFLWLQAPSHGVTSEGVRKFRDLYDEFTSFGREHNQVLAPTMAFYLSNAQLLCEHENEHIGSPVAATICAQRDRGTLASNRGLCSHVHLCAAHAVQYAPAYSRRPIRDCGDGSYYAYGAGRTR
jgi:hypothetical protein